MCASNIVMKISLYVLFFVLSQILLPYAEAQVSTNVPAPSPRQLHLQAIQAYRTLLAERDFNKLQTMAAQLKLQSTEPWFESALMILVEGIRSDRGVELTNGVDIVVPSRVRAGMMEAGGGTIVRQDVFTEGGRAAWVLERLLVVDLPEVSSGMSADTKEDAVLDAFFLVKEFLLPSERKTDLSKLSDSDKLTLAAAGEASESALAMLSKETNVDIRKAVAKHSNTPVQVLARLAYRDQSAEVRDLAESNLAKARMLPKH